MYTTLGSSSVTSSIYLNGETLTDHTSIGADSVNNFFLGYLDQVGNTSTHGQFSIDDLIISTGPDMPDTSAQCLWGYITSDNARGNWTTATGGTTNLYDAANNMYPTGNTTGTSTSHIKNSNSSGNDNYDANAQSYVTAGLPSGRKVYAVQSIVRMAETANSGPDTGQVSMASNPSDATPSTFLFGHNAGAFTTEIHGTGCDFNLPPNCVNHYWYTWFGPITMNPLVDVNASPIVRFTKKEATSHEVVGDFVGYKFLHVTSPTTPRGQLIGQKIEVHGDTIRLTEKKITLPNPK